MIQTVVFDWAGTTVDYGCFAPVQAFAEVFKKHGVEPATAEVREPMGMLKIDHIRTMLNMERIAGEWERVHGAAPSENDVHALYEQFEEALMSILHNFATPKPHVLDVMAELRTNGVKIGSTTGYTDSMMAVVAPAAQEQGYAPDFMITPDGVGGKGRPFPYMMFRNMEALGASSVHNVAKVGDTVSDVREGKAAGVFTIGVIEGSSELALTQAEFEALDSGAREAACATVERTFRTAGADAVIRTLAELPQLLKQVG